MKYRYLFFIVIISCASAGAEARSPWPDNRQRSKVIMNEQSDTRNEQLAKHHKNRQFHKRLRGRHQRQLYTPYWYNQRANNHHSQSPYHDHSSRRHGYSIYLPPLSLFGGRHNRRQQPSVNIQLGF